MHSLGKIGVIAFTCVAISTFSYGQMGESSPAPTTNSAAATAPVGPAVETIVCIRHGEIPPHEIGQLRVRGLNRALALPKVLIGKYGKPQFIFAPNPAQTIGSKDGNRYCYVRPLATIEPTAILCGLPVNTLFGFEQIKGLESELRKPAYQNATAIVVWEHAWLEKFARLMVVDMGGDGKQVPVWDDTMGFDAIYLIKITTRNGKSSVAFSVDHEGLDNLSDEFPSPAPVAPSGH